MTQAFKPSTAAIRWQTTCSTDPSNKTIILTNWGKSCRSRKSMSANQLKIQKKRRNREKKKTTHTKTNEMDTDSVPSSAEWHEHRPSTSSNTSQIEESEQLDGGKRSVYLGRSETRTGEARLGERKP